jgi:hypothetical protein
MKKEFGSKKKEIKPWTIYIWRNGDRMEGASPVVTKDGIKEIYCHGWYIEKEEDVRLNEDRHQEWRAKTKVKNLLNNTLNVINWYGRKVLDFDGNIDTQKLRILESKIAVELFRQNDKISEVNKKLPKDKKVNELDLDDIYPIKKFPQKEIDIKEAMEYGFIGNQIQDKFVDKHK